MSGIATAFVWDLADGLPLIVQGGSTNYVTGPGGLPLEQISGSSVYYYQQDQLGSTRLLTDSTGATADSWTYDPDGNVTASSGAVANPFTFSGQFSDSESGLIYLRARYYDPANGQFISRDPITSTTRQPYSYVVDNPLNATDPTGLFGWGDIQNGMVAFGRALPGPLRQSYVETLSTLGQWAGVEHDYLNSGDPLKVTAAVVDVYAIVGTVMLGCRGLGEAGDAGPSGWRGTTMSDRDSFEYHYSKHGAGRSKAQYWSDSLDWASNPNGTPKPTPLGDGTPGMTYRTPGGGPGGIADDNGNVISFWYR